MSSVAITLRPYRPKDMTQLLELEETCFAQPLRFDRDMMQSLVEDSSTLTCVAEDGASLAGFAIAELKTERRALLGYLVTIEVAPQYRRQKIASSLLHHMERIVADSGAEAMVLHVAADNDGAIHLYEKHGYKCVGTEQRFYGEAADAFIYRKVLAVGRILDYEQS